MARAIGTSEGCEGGVLASVWCVIEHKVDGVLAWVA